MTKITSVKVGADLGSFFNKVQPPYSVEGSLLQLTCGANECRTKAPRTKAPRTKSPRTESPRTKAHEDISPQG